MPSGCHGLKPVSKAERRLKPGAKCAVPAFGVWFIMGKPARVGSGGTASAAYPMTGGERLSGGERPGMPMPPQNPQLPRAQVTLVRPPESEALALVSVWN